MSVDAIKAKGNEAFLAKNYNEAITQYTKALTLDPPPAISSALYSNRSASYTFLKQYQNALQDASECIAARPEWMKGYFRKGEALEGLGDVDTALKAFSESLKLEPKNEQLQLKVTDLNQKIRTRNENATPQRCQNPEEAKTLGNSLFQAGKYDRAITFYTRAIQLDTTQSTTTTLNCLCNRAACYQQSHQYQNVIDDCSRVLKVDDKHQKALLRRAIACEGLEKWKMALEDYQRVNQISPGSNSISAGVLRCQRAMRN